MLLPRLSTLLGLAGLASIPAASAYDGDDNIKSIPVGTALIVLLLVRIC